jgi:hypothetical protein
MWPQHYVAEAVAGIGLIYLARGFHLKVGVFPLRVFRQYPKRGCKTTGDGTEEQVFWSPSALQPTEW